ncbi:MAG: type VI secretion system protein TssA [Gammaproteobacteria bacterium]|nr:type VI secretion system protein TssA [Gammaproteobacteria bacterium]
MPSPTVFDITSLLEPIAADSPAGADGRKDQSPNSNYSTIRDARKSARAMERMNLLEGDETKADGNRQKVLENWRKVLELAPKILKTQSKDIEVTCWYIEGLIRKAGFAGLRDGLSLLRQFIERFWESMYPLPDSEGVETRVAPIAGLNGEGGEGVLLAPIRSTPITENHPPGPYSLWQYKQAVEADRVLKDKTQPGLTATSEYSLADIKHVVNQSSETFYGNLYDDITACINEIQQMGQLLDGHCGTQLSPPTSNITALLTEILDALRHVAKHKLPVPVNESDNSSANPASADSASGIATGPIKSRDEAFRQLNQISQFFLRTEPHSPIAYVIDKAVKWGNMSLGELITELIPNADSRTTYTSLTGVTSPEQLKTPGGDQA